MKTVSVIALTMLLSVPAWSKTDLNSADYPMTAHVNSAIFTHTTAPSNSRVTELQIGNLIDVANEMCKDALVGSSYPARVEGRKIFLLVGGSKVCRYRVDGTKEAH